MRAKFVFEKFTQDSDPIKDMNIGYGKKPLTMAWKVLEFIKSKGEEGASLKEIQYYIWTELEGHSDKSFWKHDKTLDWDTQKYVDSGQRKTRGHWNTNLFGGQFYHTGLLHEYCKKNSKGKWVFKRYPKPGKNIYKYDDVL